MNNKSSLEIINWKEIFFNYGNNLELLQDIFYELQIEVKMETKELNKYICFKDYEKIYKISHKIKGTLSVLYCEESSDIMNKICIISNKAINEPSKEKMFQIKSLLDEFYKSLEKLNYIIENFDKSKK